MSEELGGALPWPERREPEKRDCCHERRCAFHYHSRCFPSKIIRAGAKCVKAEYRSEGYCAKAVDQYGIPTFSEPNPNSVGPGAQGQCQFSTDCPVGFQCEKEYMRATISSPDLRRKSSSGSRIGV